jgi:hypothetical protein
MRDASSHPSPHYHCERCRRPAPPIEGAEFVEWEATADGSGVICPGCLTGLEHDEIANDMIDLSREADERDDR